MDIPNNERPSPEWHRYRLIMGRINCKTWAFVFTSIATVVCLLCIVGCEMLEVFKYEHFQPVREYKDPVHSLLDPNATIIRDNTTVKSFTQRGHSRAGDTAYLAIIIFGFLCVLQLFVSIITIIGLAVEKYWLLIPQLAVQGIIGVTTVVISVTLLMTIINTPTKNEFFLRLLLLVFIYQTTFAFECLFFALIFKSCLLFRDIKKWEKRQQEIENMYFGMRRNDQEFFDQSTLPAIMEDLEEIQETPVPIEENNNTEEDNKMNNLEERRNRANVVPLTPVQ